MAGKTGRGSGWGFAVAVLVLHVVGFLSLWKAGSTGSPLWGLGILAYTLGLRHAFDVDHIVAIDNLVRKLTAEREDTTGIGFHFSIGHSSVVFLLVLGTVISVRWMQAALPQLQAVGSLVGALVSGVFLVVIGAINLAILVNLVHAFRLSRQEGGNEAEIERLLAARGLIVRLAGPLIGRVRRSWQVYGLGFLFGLGFDTASEVALLAISASTVRQGTSLTAVLALPVVFAAGMSLLDTADGIVMTKAYDWAFSTPARKLYYNLIVTGLAVLTALLVGAIELSQAVFASLAANGKVWNWLRGLDLNDWGYLLSFALVAIWLASLGVWKFYRLDRS